MSKLKTFRPPQDVLELVKSGGSVGIDIEQGIALSIGEIRKMYYPLLKAEGDLSGILWARRILRQEGLLKVSAHGNMQIPELVDLQLGPEIFAGVIEKRCDEVVSTLSEAGVPSSCVSVEEGTLVFFSKDERAVLAEDLLKCVDFPVKECTLSNLNIVDSSGSRLRSIAKFAGTRSSNCSCFSVSILSTLAGMDLKKLYLLKIEDMAEYKAEIIKVDDTLGIVLGWAIICNTGVGIFAEESGDPYFDAQGDHIPEYSMLEATTDFMLHSRKAGEMHWKDEEGEAVGKGAVIFAWPMTVEIARAFGIEIDQTGLMIAMKPDDEAMLEKFRNGEYKGFSIGGKYIPEHTEEVD